MADKYEDLGTEIHYDRVTGPITGLSEGDYTLRWLDEHPNRVPGRTITEGEARDLRMVAQHSDYAGFAGALSMRGITVVPDPEPTNAEKLEKLIGKSDFRPIGFHGVTATAALARDLDRAGVKAPGGAINGTL